MRLFVVRHARAIVDPHTPHHQWPLTEDGIDAVRRLADEFPQAPDCVVSSPEVKAIQTAEPIASRFGVTVDVDDRLRETDRPWTRGDYRAVAHSWLSGQAVAGWEPRHAVARRWDDAIEESRTGHRAIGAVIGHGLAMSVWAAGRFHVDPTGFWDSLELPCVRLFTV